MRYVSTRGAALGADGFCDVLLGGLAPDGGLVMPAGYPQVDAATLAQWRPLGYSALAYEIIARFATDIPEPALRTIIDRAYSPAIFGSAAITPVSELAPGLLLCHLSNGPTLAFKDVAMQLLGQLFEWVLAQRGEALNILGATSGDTGSAAEYAMRGRRGVNVFMLSPAGRMSAFQRAQMFSLNEPNIFNLSVNGVFDDCQDMVKAVSEDLGFKSRYSIGAVNSINWARVLAQTVYYFKAYFAATTGNDQPVSFTVPSGNFGNVLAGHIARSMGLPIRRLVVATNENDVLDEFFRTGCYRVRGRDDTHATSSPSMDISKASNFERYIFDLVGRDGGELANLWQQLGSQGFFDLSATPHAARLAATGFVSGRSTHANRIDTIRRIHQDCGRIVDPHTADGLFVAQAWQEPQVPMVCLETALPIKFADTIQEALGITPPLPAGFIAPTEAVQRYTWLPRSVPALKRYIAERVTAAPAG